MELKIEIYSLLIGPYFLINLCALCVLCGKLFSLSFLRDLRAFVVILLYLYIEAISKSG